MSPAEQATQGGQVVFTLSEKRHSEMFSLKKNMCIYYIYIYILCLFLFPTLRNCLKCVGRKVSLQYQLQNVFIIVINNEK